MPVNKPTVAETAEESKIPRNLKIRSLQPMRLYKIGFRCLVLHLLLFLRLECHMTHLLQTTSTATILSSHFALINSPSINPLFFQIHTVTNCFLWLTKPSVPELHTFQSAPFEKADSLLFSIQPARINLQLCKKKSEKTNRRNDHESLFWTLASSS